ncbi:MAG: aminotransferase class I/II-fold pyridoxal phosphate-dependent enzyme [Ignavibacteria bacterium]
MAGSNNYLGLTAHPKVKEAALKAINDYGTEVAPDQRYLTGTLDLNQLEEKLADFLGKESVLYSQPDIRLLRV